MSDRLVVILLACIGIVSVFISSWMNTYVAIVSFFLYALSLTFFTQRAGALGPLAWFPIFFFSYSSFYTLNLVFFSTNADVGATSIYLGHLALLAFSLPILGYYFVNGVSAKVLFYNFVKVPNWAFYVAWFFCLFLVFWVLFSGLRSKREVLDSLADTVFSKLFVFFVILGVMVFLRNLSLYCEKNKFFDLVAVLSIVVLFLGYGVTGERDYLFRYAFMFVVVYFLVKRKFNMLYPLLIVVVLGAVLPATQALKGVLIADSVDFGTVSQRSFFENEFSSAGRNLQYLLDSGISQMRGVTYIWDLKRVTPFVDGQESAGRWFNDVLRHRYGDGGTSGWGFSLVAEGYMNFGYYGVFFQYLLIGFLTVIVFSVAQRGGFFLVFYVFYIASLIYVQRADMANYLGFCFKLNFTVVFFVYLCSKFGRFSSLGALK